MGCLGRTSYTLPEGVKVNREGSKIQLVSNTAGLATLNLTAAVLKQAIGTVSEGYKKNLFLNGVGYRFALEEGFLTVSVGRANQYKFFLPKKVKINLQSPQAITCWSPCLKEVSEFCASVIRIRPGNKDKYNSKGVWEF